MNYCHLMNKTHLIKQQVKEKCGNKVMESEPCKSSISEGTTHLPMLATHQKEN